MSDTHYHSVPWASTAEWTYVRDGLFSGIPAQQRYAIDRIDAWRCRAPRSLPVSIISTVDLLRLALLDGVVNLEQSSDEVDDTHLRLAYSMTLVRFVNLSTEILQKKSAQAVHMLAGDIGLPEWLVNIRHEATHYTLPSMDLLRNGVSVALEWLKLTYWDEQSKDIRANSESRSFGVDELITFHDPPFLGRVLTKRKRTNEQEEEEDKIGPRDGAWEKAEFGRDGAAINWSRVPIGILPGQALTIHSLDLPEIVDELNHGVSSADLPTLTYHWHDGEVG